MRKLYEFSVNHPKAITGVMVVLTLLIGLLAALPSIWPDAFPYLHSLTIDTDPENMLREDEPVRLFHDEMKELYGLHDMVVLGVVNEEHPQGVFNPRSLKNIYELTQFAKTLQWEDPDNPDKFKGVIEVDLIAPSTVDNVEQAGMGSVSFEWLMPQPPETEEGALAVKEKASNLPFLDGTLLSEDGKAMALYIPLTSKDLSYQVASELKKKVEEFEGSDQFHITGLPVAEDQFGVEMFKQMAISAPVAMLVIFLLMLYFFRKLLLIISPMIVAMVSVILTMGLLVITGQTVHIMSSMIPIFIMPIAVLDAIHILSDFFDRYQESRDRKKTMLAVMDSLGSPMLFTSLTTMAGFASLALTPIPPVQTFGIFIAFGVLMAWLWTVTFIPAYVMFIPPSRLENFGMKGGEGKSNSSLLSRLLKGIGQWTYSNAKVVIALTLILAVISAYGISRININDNPIKWFHSNHPIRVADQVLNKHFGGTYMAYLTLEPEEVELTVQDYLPEMKTRLDERAEELSQSDSAAKAVFNQLSQKAEELAEENQDVKTWLEALQNYSDDQAWEAPEEKMAAWDEATNFARDEMLRAQLFKQPETLRYLAELEEFLLTTGTVGKSNSLTDIVKTVHRELLGGQEEHFRVPDSPSGVGQILFTYQSSHRPDDLWHFVTQDYRRHSMWIQLKSGDNMEMSRVVKAVKDYVDENPPPENLHHKWFGLTYINVIWQERMVSGMLQAFLGSFLVVLLMMTLLFRSALWGLLSMIPLTVTIGMIYGAIGLIGKDYDMPVAVLSSLSLGLAVDYAIHFLARSRVIREKRSSWKESVGAVFGEPARAITRNVIVVGVGFLPLLAAPLVPYQTVGIFIAAILVVAGVASLMILPALITLLEPLLFPKSKAVAVSCQCGTCFVAAVAAMGLVAVNIHQFLNVGYTSMTWISLVALPLLFLGCYLSSRRKFCKVKR